MQHHLPPMRLCTVLEQIDPCQVPSTGTPSDTGIATEICVSAALIWAGMSSGPSVVWLTQSMPAGTSRRKNSCRSP